MYGFVRENRTLEYEKAWPQIVPFGAVQQPCLSACALGGACF